MYLKRLELHGYKSFANRTELIKEKEVRGNFGFTFNLDSLLARFKPF